MNELELQSRYIPIPNPLLLVFCFLYIPIDANNSNLQWCTVTFLENLVHWSLSYHMKFQKFSSVSYINLFHQRQFSSSSYYLPFTSLQDSDFRSLTVKISLAWIYILFIFLLEICHQGWDIFVYCLIFHFLIWCSQNHRYYSHFHWRNQVLVKLRYSSKST